MNRKSFKLLFDSNCARTLVNICVCQNEGGSVAGAEFASPVQVRSGTPFRHTVDRSTLNGSDQIFTDIAHHILASCHNNAIGVDLSGLRAHKFFSQCK